MSSEPLVRTQIQLTPDQMRALKRLASQEGRSVAELVRRSVDALLRDQATSSADRWARASAVSGRFRSGKRDVGRRHDAYLARAFQGR